MSSLDEPVSAREMYAFLMRHFTYILSEWTVERISDWMTQERNQPDSFDMACSIIQAHRQLQAGEL